MIENSHPEDIKALIRKTGSSFAKLATKSGMTRSAFSHGVRRCIPRVNQAIASQLNKSVSELWPEWFDENGNRRLIDVKHSRTQPNSTSQKRALSIGIEAAV